MRGNFGLKLQISLANMLDFIVMEMRRVNREKGYFQNCARCVKDLKGNKHDSLGVVVVRVA